MSALYQSTEDGERVTEDALMRLALEADADHYSAEEIRGYTVAERMAAYCEAYGWEIVADEPIPADARAVLVTPFDASATRMAQVQADGHRARKGHALAAHYVTSDGILSTLVRTCCAGAGL